LVDGYNVDAVTFEEAKQQVLPRAAFETGCPQSELTITILATDSENVSQLGVTGCGAKLVYVLVAGGQMQSDMWVVNTSGSSDVPRPPPATPPPPPIRR
jgi:hypothetical protein